MARALIKWAGNLLVMLLILVAAFSLITSVFLHWQFRTVVSGSMDPTLKVGSVVATQPVDPEGIAVGDIVSYYSPDHQKLMVHRVIERSTDGQLYFGTQGDANGSPDPYLVPARNVVGKVSFHVPFLGYASRFVTSPLGLMLLLAVPGLLIIGKGIGNIRVEVSKLRGATAGTEPGWDSTPTGGGQPDCDQKTGRGQVQLPIVAEFWGQRGN